MNTSQMSVIKGSLVVFAVFAISGCDFFKKKESAVATEISKNNDIAGIVLCTINDDPVIKENDFISSLNQMIQANPYFKGATIDALPKDLQRKFFDQLATQALIEKHSIKQNVEKDPEYIKAHEETEKLLRRSLMVQMFEKKIYDNIKVDDADIQKHYAENKDRFVKTAGGVLVDGIRFDNDGLAQAFLDKAKANVDGFESFAKEEKGASFRSFGRVGKESRNPQYDAVPAPIKEAALAFSKLPQLEKVKVGKDHWVIKAWDRQDAVIFPLDEIKQHIEAMLKNNRFKDVLDKQISEIKNEFKFVVNEDYFKEKQHGRVDDEKNDEIAHVEEQESHTSTAA